MMAGLSVRALGPIAETRTEHGEPRDPPQRRPAAYRASEADAGGVGSGAAAEAL